MIDLKKEFRVKGIWQVFKLFFLLVFLLANSKLYGKVKSVFGSTGEELKINVVSEFDSPWAMTFVDSNRILVSSKNGNLWLINSNKKRMRIHGVPTVNVAGQGGLGDIILHPNFVANKLVYLSYVEKDFFSSRTGAVVVRGRLDLNDNPTIVDIERVWSQVPKIHGSGHFSHRLIFGLRGTDHEGKLFITSGDRQVSAMSQRFDTNLGKIIRINDDGSIPEDNPFIGKGKIANTFWTLGHRNILGIAFDRVGRLWAHEMGPKNGDEFNLILKGKNYGWPEVSEGDHYNGVSISRHSTQPKFYPPKLSWTPTVAPSGLIFYKGAMFSNWNGNAVLGGLRSRALVRLEFDGIKVKEVERFKWGRRVREVELSVDGSIWVLEDGPQGRLLQLIN